VYINNGYVCMYKVFVDDMYMYPYKVTSQYFVSLYVE